MGHFAKVVDGVVVQVITAEPDFFDSFIDTSPGEWIQTSYNTYGGQHAFGGTPLRKNFAGVGFVYDRDSDAFIPPQPFPSWSLDASTCLWQPPVPYPADSGQQYVWNETNQCWDLIQP